MNFIWTNNISFFRLIFPINYISILLNESFLSKSNLFHLSYKHSMSFPYVFFFSPMFTVYTVSFTHTHKNYWIIQCLLTVCSFFHQFSPFSHFYSKNLLEFCLFSRIRSFQFEDFFSTKNFVRSNPWFFMQGRNVVISAIHSITTCKYWEK